MGGGVYPDRSVWWGGVVASGGHASRSRGWASLRLRRSLAFGSGRRPPWTPSSQLDSVHFGSFWLRFGAHVQAVRSAPVLAKASPSPELARRVWLKCPQDGR